MKVVSEIFDNRPSPWGLRGDPGLWTAMQARFARTPLPYPAEQFSQDFRDHFKELCGCRLGQEESTYVQQFDVGGMSAGNVSHSFWVDTALPLLLERLESANAVNTASGEPFKFS